MFVLGIESTCDETACAVVRDGKEILSNVIYSQSEIHRPFGGVFPELACRRHVDALVPVIRQALDKAQVSREALGLIAVASGPGLIGSLLIGLNAAKSLSLAWKIPFVGVNHVEAHLYAALMSLESPPLPALGVVISGGHTFMVKINGIGSYEILGTTQDDAIGEAFDKVASMLHLPYPGGPVIERLAKQGDPHRFSFRAGQVKGRPWDFSFSGLKTSVLYAIKGANASKDFPLLISEKEKADVAAAFQETALGDIVAKALSVAKSLQLRAIFCGGGVSNNRRLQELFKTQACIPVFFPPAELTLDNAAMIAGLGYPIFQEKKIGDPYDLEPHCSRKRLFKFATIPR
ncbi:MAG TPA: tRNA (adenosine(37)-N6)-threonylcarbamoyltransferase complex transferase subunit TsaD [Rhabdochlamydiaceae bacterium]|jgi:N6-L-threonylcarbamoyladenine synthase